MAQGFNWLARGTTGGGRRHGGASFVGVSVVGVVLLVGVTSMYSCHLSCYFKDAYSQYQMHYVYSVFY